jgi:hypothetical protein
LRLSLENDGQPLQTVNLASLAGTDDQNLTTPTLVGTTLNLGIESGIGTSINLSSLQDADWYQVGGTNPANNILDNIYTGGDVSIGKSTGAVAKVDIDSNNNLQTLNLVNNNTTTGVKFGINNSTIVTNNNSSSAGILNTINGPSTWKYGIRNNFATNSATLINEVGTENLIFSRGNINLWGFNNFYSPSTSNIGFFNGFVNTIGANHNGSLNGILNSFSSNTNMTINGLINDIGGTGNAAIIGVNTNITNTGTGIKYGERIEIGSGLGGTHYGIYSDVTKANSFAGYFLGKVSIGTTTGNNYVLPLTRGTNGQIMTTNGIGDVNWTNVPTAENTTANNGLFMSGSAVRLGGNLIQNSTITHGLHDMTFNVSGNGTFKVQDGGIDKFEMNTFGDGVFGGGTYWRDGSTATTSTILGRFIPNGTAGYFQIYNGGISNHIIDGSGNTNFNVQSLDQDFIVESDNRSNMLYVDAGKNIVRIANSTGGIAQNGTVKVVNGLNITVDYIANISDNASGSTIGLGSAEFITDGGNQILMMDSNLIPFNDNDDGLGSSAYRWTSLWAIDGTINTSDLTLKKNIKPLHYGLDTLMNVETISYQWKDSPFDDKKIGFSAQNLKEIIPEVVRDYDVVVTDEETNSKIKVPSTRLGVYYSDMIPITVKAIQELKTKNDALESKIKVLEDKISRLELLEERLHNLEKK